MTGEIAEIINELRQAAARGWDDPNQLDADLRSMHGLISAISAKLLRMGDQLEDTGVHPGYVEAIKEAAAGLAGVAERLADVTAGGIMGPARRDSVATAADRLAKAVDKLGTLPSTDRPKRTVAKPWVSGPPPLPGTPRAWPADWRPPGHPGRLPVSTATYAHRAVPDGHLSPHYGLRPPPPEPMSRYEIKRRARWAWRLRQS